VYFKKAFTLAEVLITLGIIGVVAALTMPALIADYQKHALKTQFKKAFSTYSQNLQKTVMIDYDGADTKCFYTISNGHNMSGCKEFYDKFAQNMKVIKTCYGNALADGCVPVYQKYRETSGCSGSSQNNINNLNTAYVLADGSIMITYGANGYGLFLFDTNGFKGPNKAGHDLFAIDIRQNSGGGIQFFGNSEHSQGSDSILVCLPNAEIGVHDALFKTLGDIFN
jgi:prepilin-type N-terminal cleavage/methylation domain-containing protein